MNAARYLDVVMPPRFVLECLTDTGGWIDWGLYEADCFAQASDGSYCCTGAGSPMYLRCLRQDGNVIYVHDGAGDPYAYWLVSYPKDH